MAPRLRDQSSIPVMGEALVDEHVGGSPANVEPGGAQMVGALEATKGVPLEEVEAKLGLIHHPGQRDPLAARGH